MGWRTSCHGKGICKPDPYGYAFWGNTARRQVSKYPTELYKPDLVIGWSLGGLLALEIASVLSQASALIVVGIVMVDSIFPGALKSRQEDVVPHPLIMSTFCKPEIRMLVANMMKTSAKMVEQWIMPSWTGHATSRRRWNSPLPDSNSSTDSEFMSDNEDNGDRLLEIRFLLQQFYFVAKNLYQCQAAEEKTQSRELMWQEKGIFWDGRSMNTTSYTLYLKFQGIISMSSQNTT